MNVHPECPRATGSVVRMVDRFPLRAITLGSLARAGLVCGGILRFDHQFS